MTRAPEKQHRMGLWPALLVPLAGLEPAACCLGDGSAQTLCRSAKFLVAYDRRAKVILWCWRPSLVGRRRLYCPHQINVQRRWDRDRTMDPQYPCGAPASASTAAHARSQWLDPLYCRAPGSHRWQKVGVCVASSRCCVPADRAAGLGGTGPVGWRMPVCVVDRLGPQGRLGCWALALGGCRPG
jgi:hypothetical protein